MAESTNNWLSENIKQIDYYLSSHDVILVERNRMIKTMMDILGYNFDKLEGLSILDFGCGNGYLTKTIGEENPDNNFYLLDGSIEMLSKAKEIHKGAKYTFINKKFEDYITESIEEPAYDIIVSSMAIHHLDYVGKEKLYSKLYHSLKFGGIFLDYDVVKPSSTLTEKWQFEMWKSWMYETLVRNNLESDMTKHNGLPDSYKNKSENKPTGICEQLNMLKNVGFDDVDCYLKYGIFALFGGRKA